ncbi:MULTISPECIES: hypothetical protein [Pseudomonas]|uniref:hypothetical protein n=1 Tax=Pseudomonas TaxID=286 RepID=UPI001BEBEF5B|nr:MULTISPECIES: hypothetical protein [Pseudomonas]MBT2338016.1 hypothetical protein [Pseudomonas fluorescens]MCD4531480.1 hypothetical protein [Pseudomonas sp. C3-2018]
MQDGLPSLAMNVRKGLDRHRIPVFQQMIDEAEKGGEERFVELTDVPAIVEDIARGNRLNNRCINSSSTSCVLAILTQSAILSFANSLIASLGFACMVVALR